MRKVLCFILVLVLTITPCTWARSEINGEDEVKKVVGAYYDMKYKLLSELNYDDSIKGFIDPLILNTREVINEGDILDTIIKYRKAQINDLRFDNFKYKLDFEKIKIDGDKATVIFNESYELYFKCAPTVKNSSVISHIMSLKSNGIKWLIIKDDYTDPDGIKARLNKYFLNGDLSIEAAKTKVLSETDNLIDGRLKRLSTLLGDLSGKGIFVFYSGRNIVYADGISQRIPGSSVPAEINGISYLPIRFVGEKLGYKVQFNKGNSTLWISRKGHIASIKNNDRNMNVNGRRIEMEAPLVFLRDEPMVPAKAVVFAFNKNVLIKDDLVILFDNVFDISRNASIIDNLIEYFDVLFSKADFPRIDGSTATYPLSIEIGKELLGLDDTSAKGFITHKTTHNAYVNLINNSADIIFVTKPSPDELELAKKSGVELEVVPICREGFVFLVNKANKVDNLSIEQVQDIYQGKISNWKEVGGEDNIIIPYQREANSGSQTLMEGLVMKDKKLMQPPKEVLIYGMGQLIDRVADYSNAKNALGYSVFYYATQMYQTGNIKLLSIGGVSPDKESIKGGKYPFTTSYYAVLRKNEPENSNSRKLLKWLLGSEGQSIVDKAGFVEIK